MGLPVGLLETAALFGAVGMLVIGANGRLSKTRLSILEMRLLLMAALLGGAWGILLGGRLFGHKVSFGPFWALVLLFAAAWAVVVGMAVLS
jgi:uncharacterized membrane protein YsdA (DUF1294 family)